MLRTFVFLIVSVLVAACVSGSQNEVLQSAAISPGNPPIKSAKLSELPDLTNRYSYGFETQNVQLVAYPRVRKTYLINGLASSVESIGYGFTNLSKKIPGSKLHNYASFIESSTVIRSRITRELKSAYRENPNVEINLIGISFGANIVTLIAADLEREDIEVNYIATMEGPAMIPIRKNVRRADNFSCTKLDCFRTKARLSFNNKRTDYNTFKIKSSHIPLADHPDVHRRILEQIARLPAAKNASQ